MKRKLGALLLAHAAMSTCSSPSPVGTWELWSVDGLPAAQAPALRVELPEVTAFDELSAEDLWYEERLESSSLEILPEGDYRETRVKSSTLAIDSAALQRLTGRTASQPVVREDQGSSRQVTLGRWRAEGATVELFLTPEAVESSVVAAVRSVQPDVPDSVILKVVQEAIEGGGSVVQLRGHLAGDRLELHDKEGRVLVFRRSART